MSMNIFEWQPDWFKMPEAEAEKAIIAWASQEAKKNQVILFDAEEVMKSTSFKTKKERHKKQKYTSTFRSLIIKWKRVENIGIVTKIKKKEYYQIPERLNEASGVTYIVNESTKSKPKK